MIVAPTYDITAQLVDRSRMVEYRPVTEAPIHPYIFGGAGTGGVLTLCFYNDRPGYKSFVIKGADSRQSEPAASHFTKLMCDVKTGFGRTMSSLPQVFGVSRQTLYNWLKGDEPREVHRAKLEQLAAAAREFKARGFKPSSLALTRTVTRGRSFLQMITEGVDGVVAARTLERLAVRSQRSREALDALLGDRKTPRPDPSDLGQPTLPEDA
jgi:hypothetical protein